MDITISIFRSKKPGHKDTARDPLHFLFEGSFIYI